MLSVNQMLLSVIGADSNCELFLPAKQGDPTSQLSMDHQGVTLINVRTLNTTPCIPNTRILSWKQT